MQRQDIFLRHTQSHHMTCRIIRRINITSCLSTDTNNFPSQASLVELCHVEIGIRVRPNSQVQDDIRTYKFRRRNQNPGQSQNPSHCQNYHPQ